jgi:phage terminase large subunit-like protein
MMRRPAPVDQRFPPRHRKKNIKSTLAAGIMVTALMRNWRESGEFYILAPTKEIADNSFFPARDMVHADPELRAILHVPAPDDHASQHAGLPQGGRGGQRDGRRQEDDRPFLDELWLFGKRAGAEAMIREAKGGLASRPEGFVISCIDQAGRPARRRLCAAARRFPRMRDGKVKDPRSLGVLYEFPEAPSRSGDYKKRENFYITNPNLGASVDEQYLVDQLAGGARRPRRAWSAFFAKHLNVEPGMALRSDGWAGAVIWARGHRTGLTLDEILARCEVVTVGIDGGGLDDLLGVAVIGREKGTNRWLGWAHGLISTIGVHRRKANARNI